MSQKSGLPKEDLRIRRTQKMLRDAFIELVIEEGFEAITVQMLAARAMINRATFYRHYEDKFDLAEKVYTTLTAEYEASVQAAGVHDSPDAWLLLIEHLAAYADFYLGMLAGMPRFREHVRDNIEAQLHAEFLRQGLDESTVALPLPIILRYLATAQMGVVQWWLETGQPIPASEIAQHLFQLHFRGGIQPLGLPSFA